MFIVTYMMARYGKNSNMMALLLSEPGNYAVMMEFDFFQSYKHVQYSMGAIYLTILNLPRGVRSKQENTILVGLIPGPH